MPRLSPTQRESLNQVLLAGPKVRRLTELFAAAGHELYLVGGSVRDAILGGLGNDLDYTTSARPDEIEALVRQVTAAVWDVGRAYGTIACLIREDDGAEWLVEVTTFRADTYADHTRKPEVAFGDHLGGDLVRRDFTVNAMALRATDGELLDPFDGLGDLLAGVIRTPAAAELSFSDDPLRILRAARFTSQLGFVPAPEVVVAMREMAPRLEIVSPERIRDELVKLLLTDNPRPGLNLLVETGVADVVLPELPALRMERDEHNRHKDVYEHTLTVLEQAIRLERARGHAPDLINRLAALFHDIGKPRTRRFEADGKVSFHHHDVVGAKLTRKRMQALHFSSEETRKVGPAGRAAPAVPRLRRRAVDGLGGAPLRPRRRGRAGAAAHPDPLRLHHPERGARRTGCARPTSSWSGGSTNSPPRRSSTRCVRISTGRRSWPCWGSAPARWWGRRTGSCWNAGSTPARWARRRPRPNCGSGGPTGAPRVSPADRG